MKRLIALADTHLKSWNLLKKLLELMDEADFVVHAGDFVTYPVYLNQFHDLRYKALELDVDVLLFGHLHRFVSEEVRRGGKLLLLSAPEAQHSRGCLLQTVRRLLMIEKLRSYTT